MSSLVVSIILGVIAILANNTMDEIRFHWSRFFGKIVKPNSNLELWMNPNKSFVNKYNISKNKILAFLFSTVLSFVTDFWHFLKALFLNLIYLIILIQSGHAYSAKEILSGLLLLNTGWFIIFEIFIGIYGSLSDRVKKWKKK